MAINTLQIILNQAANALQLYPADSLWIKLIPAVISVFNELILFSDAKDVEERLAELETRVESMGIEQQQFSDLVNGLSPHEKYAFRNFLKHYCLEALPEVTDAMICALVDFVADKKSDIREEICEILKQFNAVDIESMRRIREIVLDEEITRRRRDETLAKIEEQKGRKWKDTVIYLPGRTILWEDFIAVRGCGTDADGKRKEWIPNVRELMTGQFTNSEEKEVVLSQFPRSVMKLQSLGVLIIYNTTLTGSSPMFNIEKFILTNYGVKILEYIS